MTIPIESGAEPIPGYKLLHRLGSGGFGEVWAAEAPGGVPKAIKVLFGNLQGLSEDVSRRVRQELRSLRRIQDIRHPYLLSLERYDIVDGKLLIVMELAERNLAQRFEQCRSEGLPGIPRDELLRYMEEAAEALDVMNLRHRLQHLDIKPQNLLLSVNHVKVADFGLVKYLEETNVTRTGGCTPAYAAPEMFQGTVSRCCDQYSLALVFQELLTGQRPFPATKLGDLMRQHLNERPNLSPLPPEDRDAIARALAKKPTDRFASCSDLVRCLRSPASAVPVRPRRESRKPVENEEGTLPEVVTGDGVLGPTLVIGLGGMGLQTLHELREMVHDRFGSVRALPTLRLLLIDTESVGDDRLEDLLGADRALRTPLHRAPHYLRPGAGRAPVDGWIDPKTLYQIPREPRTDGLRSLGRLALVDHYRTVAKRLRSEIRACTESAALRAAEQLTGLGLRSSLPRVWIVTGLAGGTGSGMFLDLAYIVRRQLRELGYRHPEVIGLFFLPAVENAGGSEAERSRALANSVAALTELHHFSAPGTSFSASYEGDEDIDDDAGPFAHWWLLTPAAVPETSRAADFLFAELTTTLARRGSTGALSATGAFPSAATAPEWNEAALAAEAPPTVGTFGLSRIRWPRRQVIKQAARALGARLAQSWVAERAGPLEEKVHEWLTGQWAKEGLGAERLIEHLERASERVLGESPLDTFRNWIDSLCGGQAVVEPASVLRLQERIRALLGGIAISATLSNASGSALDQELDGAAGAWAADWGKKWGDLAWSLADQRSFRFAGAEAAVRQADALVRETLKHHEALARDLAVRAEQVTRTIDPLLAELRDNPRSRRRIPELADALRRQVEGHYRRKILARVLPVFAAFPELMSQRQREIASGRVELGQLFADAEPAEPSSGGLLAGRLGAAAAVAQFLGSVTPADLDELDRDVQTMIEKQYQSLSRLCLLTSWAHRFQKLARSIQRQAAVFVQDRVGFPDILEKWLGGDEMRQPLVQAFEQAVAGLGPAVAGAPRLEVLALPASPLRARFWDLARASLPANQFRGATSSNDVLFYVEQESSGPAALMYLGHGAERAYFEAQEPRHLTPHSRLDVAEWLPLADSDDW